MKNDESDTCQKAENSSHSFKKKITFSGPRAWQKMPALGPGLPGPRFDIPAFRPGLQGPKTPKMGLALALALSPLAIKHKKYGKTPENPIKRHKTRL
jgi:hypothetical protein